MLKIAVTGASGRMGQQVMEQVLADKSCALVGALLRPGHALVGQDVSKLLGGAFVGVKFTADADRAFTDADAVIDFSLPDACIQFANAARRSDSAFITGTTGLNDVQEEILVRVSSAVPVVWGSNMSLGVNLLMALVEQAAARLGKDYDIEIVEMHHNQKLDAPSGTALSLGEAAAAGRKVDLTEALVLDRSGKRQAGDIGFAVLRGGDVVGDHEVMFAGPGERLILGHKASNRGIFARGAIAAAKWAYGRPAGFYGMKDVLDL